MRSWQIGWAVVLLAAATVAAKAEKGLVAHYTFDEGKGVVLKDHSGNGNSGMILNGAKWVKGPFGTALEFDGKDDYVNCGTPKSLNIAAGGTVMIWCRPETVQGGLVNWSTGGGWNDERLVLCVNTYHGGANTLGCMADGKGSRGFSGFGNLLKGQWLHLAYTFDGETISVYRDGLLNGTSAQALEPNIKGVPMWIGRCQGLGKDCFHGLLDEVRVYSRPLSGTDILVIFKKDAPTRGKDMSVFHKVGLEAHAYPGPGKIIANLDARAMQPLPEGTRLRAELLKAGARTPIMTKEVSDIPEISVSEFMFDVQKLPAGSHVVRAAAIGPDGSRIQNESSVSVDWAGQPAAFRNIKILNNLCWELLNVNGASGKLAFTLPCDRWIFIRTTARIAQGAEARIGIDSDARSATSIVHSRAGETTLEAMRYLKSGKHVVHIGLRGDATVQRLIVRAIPALQHAFYNANPHIGAYGPYDWKFLEKDVRPNVNVMISGGAPKPEHIKAWKASGRKWIGITNIFIPGLDRKKPDALDKIYKHWSSSIGYRHPLMDGVIVDEFGGGDAPVYDLYRKAVEKLNANFKGRMYMPYGGRFYGNDRSTGFARAAFAGGGYTCPEHYLTEQSTEEAARRFIHRRLVAPMPLWEEGLPGSTQRMIVVLGYMSQPTESCNINPSVDFKVYMDMQVRTLATHPACFGLGGIQEYHSSYCDEENVRWTGRLYRHYAIEGNTEPATKDPYKLTHIRNPDFADGTQGWTVLPAEQGSIRAAKHPGYSHLEGRYPRTSMGDTFLVMKRSAKKPNTFSQAIKDLQAGRLYSMKMITADYKNLVQEKSEKKQDAVSIKLDNVDILPGPKKSFQFTFPNCYAHHLGKFTAKHNYWMNYHWRVFRAKGTTAKLTVSDWKAEQKPDGPIAQELIYNFIEVQPYIGD